MDTIMHNIDFEKKTKSSSPSKTSLTRRKSITSLADDLLGTDTLPVIDPSKISSKDRQKVERMRHREHR